MAADHGRVKLQPGYQCVAGLFLSVPVCTIEYIGTYGTQGTYRKDGTLDLGPELFKSSGVGHGQQHQVPGGELSETA